MHVMPQKYFVEMSGNFPGSKFPVLHYEQALSLPAFFPGRFVKELFQKHHWSNNWRSGIYTFNHYHSISHEVIAVIKGQAVILLGGENGKKVLLRKGDVMVIPAGVAHMNLGKERDIICIGGYPWGRDYDMNYGKDDEHPLVDENIRKVPLPDAGPLYGPGDPLIAIWKSIRVLQS